MGPLQITLIVILVILIAIIVALYFIGKRAKKKQAEQQEAMEAAKQNISMLVIDKKHMKLKDAGLPQAVIDNTPKLMRGQKLPIVKAKIGPQIMSLVADEKIFDQIPTKKEVKATIAGIFIMSVKGIRGNNVQAAPVKKKGRFKKMVESLQEKAGAKPLDAKKHK